MRKAWPWVVPLVAFLLWFAFWETMAFIEPDKYWTLSYTVAFVGAKWPFSIFLAGGLVVGLGVHFYWAWPGNPEAGGG